MDTERLINGPCPISRALAHVGDCWSFLILREAGLGRTRFEEFRLALDIAPNILTRRLAALVAGGLLDKRRYSQRPPRDEYVLTAAGIDFLPILLAMGEWGRRHNGAGSLSHVEEVATGREVRALVVDAATGRPIEPGKVRLVLPDTPSSS